MSTALRIVEKSELSQLEAAVESAYQEFAASWIAYVRRVNELKDSKAWRDKGYTRWEDYCTDNMRFAAATYREAEMNIPIAELAQTVAATTLSREEANRLGKKLNEVIPSDERTPMRLSVLALALAYQEDYDIDKPVPDKQVIEGAYEVLKEERNNHTVSVDGKSYDFREKAQVMQLRERIAQNVAAHSTKVTIAIEIDREIGLFRRLMRRLGHDAPNEDKKLFISWKD